MTIAQLVTDAVITHSVNLLRYQAGLRGTINRILSDMQIELLGRLATETMSGIARARLSILLEQANRVITGRYQEALMEMRAAAEGVAIIEAKAHGKWLADLFGAHIDATLPAPDHLKALAKDTLIYGQDAAAWWKRQGDDTAFRYAQAVRQGVAQGEPNDKIVRRIVGTKGGAPGVVQVSAANARKLIHQSVQTVANASRLDTFRQNADVIRGVRQVSTLDDKVSLVCLAYDGAAWDLDGEPIDGTELPFVNVDAAGVSHEGTPRHWNCRSVLVPITKTFAELGIDVPEPDQNGRASIDGPTKKGITFEQFLDGKPEAFQNELLGPGRAQLWRDGKISRQDLLDMSGNPLTLKELLAKYA